MPSRFMQRLIMFIALAISGVVFAAMVVTGHESPKGDVDHVLDDFHRAASEADGERYFAHFAPGGVFLGTDSSERWTVGEFQAYAEPFFEQGRGWTYVPRDRHIAFNERGDVAWFDELLDSDKYGEARGSGVLVKSDGHWKIAHYSLSFPIPNDVALEVVGIIDEHRIGPDL